LAFAVGDVAGHWEQHHSIEVVAGANLQLTEHVGISASHAVRAERARVLDVAYATHPERFVRKPPAPPELPTVAWINQPKEGTLSTTNP
jgi:putative transposase